MIACDQVQQTINQLKIAFQDCTKLKASDMQLLVDLIAAVGTCSNGGTAYDYVYNDIYEPDEDEIVNYSVNSFHAISVVVTSGQIIYNGITLTSGTSINLEFTTKNQQAFIFTAKAGSKVLVEYITDEII